MERCSAPVSHFGLILFSCSCVFRSGSAMSAPTSWRSSTSTTQTAPSGSNSTRASTPSPRRSSPSMWATSASWGRRSSSTLRYKHIKRWDKVFVQKRRGFKMSNSQRKSYSRPVRQPRLHPAHLGGGGRSHPELPHRRQTSTVQGTKTHVGTSAAPVSVTVVCCGLHVPPLRVSEHRALRRLHYVQGLRQTAAEGPEEDRGRTAENERRAERRQVEGEERRLFFFFFF